MSCAKGEKMERTKLGPRRGLRRIMITGGRLNTDIGRTEDNPLKLRTTPMGPWGEDPYYEQRYFYGRVAFVEIDGQVRKIDSDVTHITQLWVDRYGEVVQLAANGWIHDATDKARHLHGEYTQA